MRFGIRYEVIASVVGLGVVFSAATVPAWAQQGAGFFSDAPATPDPDATPEEEMELTPAEEMLRGRLNFRFVERDDSLTREEIRRIRQLSESVRYIEMSINPQQVTHTLKRNEPAESLRVERTADDEAYLWISVNYLRYGIDRHTVVRKKISDADWNDLIDTVTAHNLVEWTPIIAGSDASRNDAYRFKIGSVDGSSQLWFGALENGRGPRELTNKLTKLARRTVPYLPLAYLRPVEITVKNVVADD